MQPKLCYRFLVTVIVLGLSEPMQAAGKKSQPSRKALVAAVQAVSPDALGGRLGLNLAPTNLALSPAAVSNQRVSAASSKSPDHVAYRSWKSSNKS